MDNSFFILSNKNIEISRFHICTWDIENADSFIEMGIEFDFPENNSEQEIVFKFVIPFIKKEQSVKCLLSNLISDTENSKFIFNDNVESFKYIDEHKKAGGILTFAKRESLLILPVDPIIEDGQIMITIKKPKKASINHSYIRFLINTKTSTLSIVKKGITQNRFIFDVKLNEKRNLPDKVYNLLKDEYTICNVKKCFCLHVVPNSYTISFVNSPNLKNIRELEVPAFKKYLPDKLDSMKEDRYMIIFNKGADSDSYSFFTIFTKEIIGTNQILLAIGANILCSLLFGFAAMRVSFNCKENIWANLPIEYWIAIIILIILVYVLFIPRKFPLKKKK